MLLTVEPPDASLSQRDNSAEVRAWLDADRRSSDAATEQISQMPSSKWMRELWAAAAFSGGWDLVADRIADAVAQGCDIQQRDLEFLARTSGELDAGVAAAAIRTLGLLVDEHPSLVHRISIFLESGLRHSSGTVRASAAEAIWLARSSSSVEFIRKAAAVEKVPSVRAYMLHAAELLAKS
jgi:hypothetical protein